MFDLSGLLLLALVAGLEKAFIKRVDPLNFFFFRAVFMRIAEAEPSGGGEGGCGWTVRSTTVMADCFSLSSHSFSGTFGAF